MFSLSIQNAVTKMGGNYTAIVGTIICTFKVQIYNFEYDSQQMKYLEKSLLCIFSKRYVLGILNDSAL